MNLSNTIIPKSDQLNADDLISGPRTIRITAVESGSAEQPVCIRYEGDANRPYKPSKSMRRVLVAMWGSEGRAYVGRRITIYRDPAIRFGGDAVGGIRISHASDIDRPLEIALTETRGKRKPYRVDPLPAERPAAQEIDRATAEDIGETKAREGSAALKAWWATLPSGVKTALKEKLDADWKPLAESVESKGGAS